VGHTGGIVEGRRCFAAVEAVTRHPGGVAAKRRKVAAGVTEEKKPLPVSRRLGSVCAALQTARKLPKVNRLILQGLGSPRQLVTVIARKHSRLQVEKPYTPTQANCKAGAENQSDAWYSRGELCIRKN